MMIYNISMKLIVGLGNFGEKYENTRHNVGFSVLDEIARKLDLSFNQKKFNCLFIYNNDFILIKPLTYMNLSGEAVKKVMDFYKLNCDDLIVIHDDLDIKLGQAKIKISNSAGGHNGIKNIIDNLKSSEFYRVKVGIGRPENKKYQISSYVLEKFTDEQQEIIDKVVTKTDRKSVV